MIKRFYSILVAGLYLLPCCPASKSPENLIKNGDFEAGTSGWEGNDNIVFETSSEKNKICRMAPDEDSRVSFHQVFRLKDYDHLTARFRLKKSADYNGEGLTVWFRPNDGSGHGVKPRLPDNTDWNVIEIKRDNIGFGTSEMKLAFELKPGRSGTLSIDDIEVYGHHAAFHPTGDQGLLSKVYDLSDIDGRTIEAVIIAFDPNDSKVTLRKKGSRKLTKAPIDIFNEDSQTQIRSWFQISDFLNERSLYYKLSQERNVVADESQDLPDAGISYSQIYEGHHIEGFLYNKSSQVFHDVKLEYTLYYSQIHFDHVSVDGSRNRTGTLYKTNNISIPPSSELPFKSEQIITYDLDPPTSDIPNLDGEFKGIMVRLTLETETGALITREFVYPETRSFRWTTKTLHAQFRLPQSSK